MSALKKPEKTPALIVCFPLSYRVDGPGGGEGGVGVGFGGGIGAPG